MKDRLPIEQFGQQLLTTGDLDPVYIALHQLTGNVWSQDQTARWLLAYWCTYHCGFACYVSESTGEEFWAAMFESAQNVTRPPVGVRWPRGAERRHWRGAAAISSCESLRARYAQPEEMLCYIAQVGAPGPQEYSAVAARAREHVGFGPWIAFKIADMIDRLGYATIAFDQPSIFMFDAPRESALRLFRERNNLPETAKLNETKVIDGVVNYLTRHFANHKAPPRYERPVGLQEVETILCKWKSHANGHYPLNNDIEEIRHGVAEWATVCRSAAAFNRAMPQLPSPKGG